MLLKIKSVLRKYPVSTLTTILFFICCIYATFGCMEYTKTFSLMHLFFAFVNTSLLFSIVYLISRIPKVRILFILFLSTVLTVDITHLMAYQTKIMFGAVASMFETNKTEALGMMEHLWLYAIPVFISCVVCLYFMTKEFRKSKLRIKPFVVLFLTTGIILPIVLVVKDIRQADDRMGILEDYPLLVIHEVIGYRYPIGYGSLFITAAYIEEARKMKQFVDKEKTLPSGVEFKGLEGMPQTVYVLVGESSLRNNYSLYGYDIPTSPFIDSIYWAQELYKVDAVSPGCLTRDAVKMTLSFATPKRQDLFHENCNAVELANRAGYSTYWISNQEKLGVHDSNIGFIAANAGYREFHSYQEDDLWLISIADSLYDKTKHQVFFIHLKGSHLSYGDKSDTKDDLFAHLSTQKQEVVKVYDKSIHHTDRVIASLYNNIKERKDTSSLVYYYSDHGEIIGSGHGFLNEKMEQFAIPFIAIPFNSSLDIDKIVTPYLNNGEFNSVNFINIFAQSIGYSLSDEFIRKAKEDGLYYYHVDRKVHKFD